MTAHLETSSAFASATAEGQDWRDIGRKILEKLDSIRTPDDGMNIGFIYATHALTDDLQSLLALLKNVTRIQHWYGALGQGICGGGKSYTIDPAAVAMIGRLPAGSFQGFQLPDTEGGQLPANLRLWLSGHMSVATIMHGVFNASMTSRLATARDRDGLYMVGGFSGGDKAAHVADGNVAPTTHLSGVAFDADIQIMTATSMGCVIAGAPGRITRCLDNTINTINDKPAFAYLREAIDEINVETGDDEKRHGHVHVAFPVTGSDTGPLLVRNITHADEKAQSITVAHNVMRGDPIQFVYRDRGTALSDLSSVLKSLYTRGCAEVGAANFRPKALLYFGCGARMPQGASDTLADEAATIKDIMGDIPMAGFYTAAEICNGHAFGYTGVIVLFL